MLDKVSERVFVDTSGNYGGNFGCVVLEDQIVFIDAGMVHTHTAKVLEWALKEFSQPMKMLIYTHSHSDHVFGAQGLGNVSIIGSAEMKSLCEENMKDRWKHQSIIESMLSRKTERPALWNTIQTLQLKLPDIIFENRLVAGPSRDLTIVHRGGHTSGSSTISVEPEHILFIGDLIFNGVFPYAADPTCDPDRWIKVLDTITTDGYDTIIPGHGPICTNDELRTHISFLTELRESIKSAIGKGISQDEFLTRGLIPDYYKDGHQSRGSMTVSHFYNFYGAIEG